MSSTSDPTKNDNPLQPAREWASFVAEDGDTWMFDLTFFRSNYHCIYGQGCAGIEEEPDPDGHRGCCSYGAHFVDEDDLIRVIEAARTLTAGQWHNATLFPELGSDDASADAFRESLTLIDDDGDQVLSLIHI